MAAGRPRRRRRLRFPVFTLEVQEAIDAIAPAGAQAIEAKALLAELWRRDFAFVRVVRGAGLDLDSLNCLVEGEIELQDSTFNHYITRRFGPPGAIGSTALVMGVLQAFNPKWIFDCDEEAKHALDLRTQLQDLLWTELQANGLGREHAPPPYSSAVSDILDLKLNSTAEVLDQILARPDCIGAQVLARLGFSGHDPTSTSATVPSYSMNDLLERAKTISQDMKAAKPNTGHLLLAIFGDAWSSGAQVLINAGLYYEAAWIAVAQSEDRES